MTVLNFPSTTGQPTDGSFTYIENGVIYTWNGSYWAANNADNLDSRYVNVGGDTMTGDLTVPNLISEGDVQTTSLNGGPLAGFRNQLINGGMSVNQRGLTLYPSGRANDYTVDRWLTSTGMSVSWYSDTNFMPAGFTAAIEIGVVPGQEAVINQRIEQPNAGFWAAPGSTWTLSAWVDTPDNFELNLDYRNGANAILASFSKVGALVKGETDGIFTRVSQVFTAPAFTAGTEYTQANFANLTSGENTRFTGAQLEPGPVATPFEHRPIGTELALCQRYYYGPVDGIGRTMYPITPENGNKGRRLVLVLPTTMRIPPTCTGTLNVGSGLGFQSCEDYIRVDGEAAVSTQEIRLNSLTADAEL